MVAVLGQIDDVGEDLLACLDRVPQQLEDASGHLGMTDDIVRLSEEFFLRIDGHPLEDVVGVGDQPLPVRLADDDLVVAEIVLDAGRLDTWCVHWSVFVVQEPVP